jgi:hypothetical protein
VFNQEQYYLDKIKSVYNILKITGYLQGYRDSKDNKSKINYRIVSETTLSKTRTRKKGEEIKGKITLSRGIPIQIMDYFKKRRNRRNSSVQI